MKKFKFNLESVRRLREHREQEALAALGRAQGALSEAQRRFEVAEAEMHAAQLRQLEPHLQAQRELYIHRLRIRSAQLREEVYLRAGEVENAREAAAVAQSERKAVDRLRERRLSEWEIERQREEDRTLSEVHRRP